MTTEFILLILGGTLVFIMAIHNLTPRRSESYRKQLMDMYVAAKIKFLAKSDNLDIVEEFESFKKWCKKQNLDDKDLDQVIERDLKERVAEQESKKAPKETKPKK